MFDTMMTVKKSPVPLPMEKSECDVVWHVRNAVFSVCGMARIDLNLLLDSQVIIMWVPKL